MEDTEAAIKFAQAKSEKAIAYYYKNRDKILAKYQATRDATDKTERDAKRIESALKTYNREQARIARGKEERKAKSVIRKAEKMKAKIEADALKAQAKAIAKLVKPSPPLEIQEIAE